MNKKGIAIFVLVFVAGFVIGGWSVISYFGRSFIKTNKILLLQNRADWERRAFQAYSQEDPKVAIWALNNLSEALKEQSETAGNDRELIQKDLVLTYARLAIVSRTAKDMQKYDQYMSEALALSKDVYLANLHTEAGLLSFVKESDGRANKKSKQ